MRSRPAKWWVGAAFAANLFLALSILVARGVDAHGTRAALIATGRVTFIWFWPAYAGGPLATLFGAALLPLKQRGRELGLAFAAALLVHLALVGWLCWIGATPSIGLFIRFGTAASITVLLAFFSLGSLHALLGPGGWRLLRTIGMNYILYVFLYDFWQNPLQGGIPHLVEYLPFTVMAIAAALLQVAAWGVRLRLHSTPEGDVGGSDGGGHFRDPTNRVT
ncbi:hypothetical protein [Bradyrhizobium jicamae]|uniref:hypothetical protein n=1 Tax=Bradyrhizobium jicamae TaxID=280332 RepID=UPI001BA9419D|nr:hypothetical protein [Bradyrhizobium jicamae]MBR0938862.1 hypothetical protein [Bradyrhizobium jicamae]